MSIPRSGDSAALGVLALSGLLRHAEHEADLGPRSVVESSPSDGSVKLGFDGFSLVGEFAQSLQRRGVEDDEIFHLNEIGPSFVGSEPFGP